MKRPAAAIAMAAAVLASATRASEPDLPAAPLPAQAWRFAIQRIHHNDAMPLAAMDGDDHSRIAPRPGRNLAYIDDEIRLEYRSSGWAFSLLARQQATLVVDDQALALARIIETGRRPASGAQWRIDARFRGFSGAGVELRRELALRPGWSAELWGQLLALANWHERELRGTASYDSTSRTYDFDIVSDELYNRLHFDYERAQARNGAGLLLGAALQWDDDSTSIRVALGDGGWLHWNGVPRQTLSLAADRQGVDADGFVVYGPLLEGRDSQAAATRMQPWRANLALSQRTGEALQLLAGADWLPDYGALPWLGAGTRAGDAQLRVQWHVHERRLSAGLQWRGLALRVGADRLGAAAHSREAALTYTLALP